MSALICGSLAFDTITNFPADSHSRSFPTRCTS